MSDNLDDFLNSLGITEETQEEMRHLNLVQNPVVRTVEASAMAHGDLPPDTQNLSDQDFADILEDFGFNGSQQAEAEELQEENEEEEEEFADELQQMETSPGLREAFNRMRDAIQEQINTAEGTRDLDAEEDADWQEAIDSGGVVPVVSENDFRADSSRSVTPLSPAERSRIERFRQRAEALSRSNIHVQMPNGEVIDAPIVQEGLQQLEQNAINAYQAVQEASNTQQEPSAQGEELLIPLNSPTLLMDESTTRFSGAEWYNEIQKKSIIVAGQGGIGSNLSFQLARMHPAALFLYDDDMVETVNMAGQLYARNDVGKSKVAAISDMITAYTNMQNIYAIKDKFTAHTEAGDIMLCGFDNMEARRTFYASWRNHIRVLSPEHQKRCLFLDGRLSIDTLQVFCLTGDDGENQVRYEDNYLFSDAEAEHTVCSMKQTTYLACMIGSIMVNLFTNFCANQLDPVIPYDLPFFTEYDAQNMIFKTEK